MFKVMVLQRTFNSTITRQVGMFGGPTGLQRATDFAEYWRTANGVLLAWID